jgi:outer membrane lipase/esterase
MKTRKRVLPALLLSIFAGALAPSASAQLAQFSGVYVFGDSLSDAGYYRSTFLASLGLPAPVLAGLGRYTTNPGPVFSELLTQYYGFTPAPSNLAGGNIFAQGGARVTLPSPVPLTPPGVPQRSVTAQIDEFLARNNGAADPNGLYTVWVGANDIFANLGAFQAGAITQAQLQTNVLGAAAAEIPQIGRLQAAGARYIVVFGLPDIGAAPAFVSADAATRGAVTQLSAGYNTTLFSGLAGAGVRVIPVDAFSLLNEIRANPSAYGFTNVTSPACGPFPPITTTTVSSQFCLIGTNLVAPNAQLTYLFADGVHPTTAGHAIIAQLVESMIEGPTAYSLLAEAPLRSRAGHVRTLEDGLLTGGLSDIGRMTVFATANRGNFDLDQGADSSNKAGSIGVTARVSEAVTLGVAIGKSTSDGSFGRDIGGYRSSETVLSAFASARWGGFYGLGIVSIADISFTGVSRNIVLGSSVRSATARPEGSNASAYFNVGYDFPIGALRIGPTVSVTAQNVEVNQFDEADAGSANLRIGAQQRRSEVWSAGVHASMALGRWTPWVRITADRERRDQARVVTATPLSIASQNSYDVPALAPDKSFMTGAIGIRGTLMDRVGLSLAYFKVSGRSGVKEDGVSGLLSYRF